MWQSLPTQNLHETQNGVSLCCLNWKAKYESHLLMTLYIAFLGLSQTIVDGFADVAHLLEPKKFSVPFPLLSQSTDYKSCLDTFVLSQFHTKKTLLLLKTLSEIKASLACGLCGEKTKGKP